MADSSRMASIFRAAFVNVQDASSRKGFGAGVRACGSCLSPCSSGPRGHTRSCTCAGFAFDAGMQGLLGIPRQVSCQRTSTVVHVGQSSWMRLRPRRRPGSATIELDTDERPPLGLLPGYAGTILSSASRGGRTNPIRTCGRCLFGRKDVPDRQQTSSLLQHCSIFAWIGPAVERYPQCDATAAGGQSTIPAPFSRSAVAPALHWVTVVPARTLDSAVLPAAAATLPSAPAASTSFGSTPPRSAARVGTIIVCNRRRVCQQFSELRSPSPPRKADKRLLRTKVHPGEHSHE
jgi:hypothetical protein